MKAQPHRVRSFRRAGLVALVAAAAGCDNADTGGVQTGHIYGTVRTGGVPTAMTVRATRAPGGGTHLVEAEVASDGSYALELPRDRWTLGLRFDEFWGLVYEWTAAGLVRAGTASETIAIGSGPPMQVDFDFAALRVQVSLPDGPESAALVLHPQQGEPVLQAPLPGSFAVNEDGRVHFAVAGIIPGRYKLEFVLGPGALTCTNCAIGRAHVWFPGVREPLDSPVVQLAPNTTTTLSPVSLAAVPSRIEGRIGGAWLELGLGPPAFALFTPDSTVVRSFDDTGADGGFAADVLIPGPVKLLVRHEGIDHWAGGGSFADATVFELRSGQTVSGIEIIESGLQIEFDPRPRNVNLTSLRLYDATTRALAAEWRYPSDTDAVLGMPNLRPGTYLLHVEPIFPEFFDFQPQWYDRSATPEGATPLVIRHDGDIATATVTFEPRRAPAAAAR